MGTPKTWGVFKGGEMETFTCWDRGGGKNVKGNLLKITAFSAFSRIFRIFPIFPHFPHFFSGILLEIFQTAFLSAFF
jgi:hypothetical protein